MDDRGSGRTTQQMLNAPLNSVFIWCNHRIDYPKRLACDLNRNDLVVVPPSWLSSCDWVGQTLTGIVIDHAAKLTGSQQHYLIKAIERIRQAPQPTHQESQ